MPNRAGSPVSPSGPSGQAPRGLLILLCASGFTGELIRGLTGLLLPDLSVSLSVSPALAGQLVTAMLVTGAAANFLMGLLSDLFGRRLFLVVGPLAIAFAAAGLALAPSYPFALAACAVGGFGFVNSVAYAVAGDMYSGAGRDRAAARMMGANALAWVLGLPLLGMIEEGAGWRVAVVALATFALTTAVATQLTLPPDKRRGGQVPLATALRAIWEQHRGRPDVVYAIASNTARVGGYSIFVTYMATYFVQAFALSTWQAGIILSLGAAGVLGGTEIASRLMSRSGPRPLAVASSIGSAAAGAAVLLTPSLSLALAIWLLFGLLFGIASATIPAQMLRLAPASRGTTMALFQALGYAGSAVGAAGGGLALATIGFPGLAAAMAVFFMLSAWAVEWSGRARATVDGPTPTPQPPASA